MSKVNRSVARDPALRMQNLQLLVSRIKHFYLTSLQQLVITSLPNISVICHTPESGQCVYVVCLFVYVHVFVCVYVRVFARMCICVSS